MLSRRLGLRLCVFAHPSFVQGRHISSWKDIEYESEETDGEYDIQEPQKPVVPIIRTGFGKPQIKAFLSQQGLEFKENARDEGLVLKECPFCHPIKGDPSNMFKLGITTRGSFHCFRCNSSGNWAKFKELVGGGTTNTEADAEWQNENTSSSITSFAYVAASPEARDPSKNHQHDKAQFPFNMSTPPIPSTILRPIEEISNPELVVNLLKTPEVLTYLTGTEPHQRWLSPETLKLYEVGATISNWEGKPHHCVTLPQFDPYAKRTHIARTKLRSITSKACMRVHRKGAGEAGWFGWNTLDPNAEEVVITEGEFDAMAVRQGTGKGAISIPSGANGGIPAHLLPSLERFKTIYLWFDDDNPGRDAMDAALDILGRNRCKVVLPSEIVPELLTTKDAEDNVVSRHCKDANDALRLTLDMHELLERAPQERHDKVVTFTDFRSAVQDQFDNAEKYKGLASVSLKALTDITGGHRRGEVTILTGPTGSGKTTFLSQHALDFCEHEGMRTLWGSFEIKLERLVKNMMIQFSAGSISPITFETWADKFAADVPMYFMSFFGATAIKDVLDAMRYAVDVYQVEHVILDNLQFMSWGFAEGVDRFELQDRCTAEFRKFATERNCHISLVIHPRKEVKELGMESIFGSAKSTQEADNVIILQTMPDGIALKVIKNRFTGDLGTAYFKFNKTSLLLEACDPPDGTFIPRSSRQKITRAAVASSLAEDEARLR